MIAISKFHRRRALQLYPQLERAVQPVPLVSDGPSRFRPGDVYRNYFWEDHKRDFHLRVANDASSVISVEAYGFCLYPIRSEGDVMHFDPTMPAQRGDIVLFQHPKGATPHLFMSKMLIEFGGEYWLAWKDGMFPLGDTRILGVEVHVPSSSCEAFSKMAEAFNS